MAVFPLTAGARLMASEHAPGGHRYEVRRVIGQGGFGITYLAADLVLGGECVVKEFAQTDLCARGMGAVDMAPVTGREAVFARWIERFSYEARLIHRIRHPNVVAVRDVWTQAGTAYYAMDYVPDARELGRNAVPWAQVRPALMQLVAALTAVHDAGLIHGDVKPENVLVDPLGRVVLIDFGTARMITDLRRTVTTTMFTRGYAPLELTSVVTLRGAGPWSDLYSWGMLAFGMVRAHLGPGGLPVEAATREAIVMNQGVDPYDGAEEAMRAAGVPAGWSRAIAACISMDARARPQDGRALFELAGESLPVVSESGPLAGLPVALEPTLPSTGGAAGPRRSVPGRSLLTGERLQPDGEPGPEAPRGSDLEDAMSAHPRGTPARVVAPVLVVGLVACAVAWAMFRPRPTVDDAQDADAADVAEAANVPPDVSCTGDSTCGTGVCRNGHCTERGWVFAPAGEVRVATSEGSGSAWVTVRAPRGLHAMQSEVTQGQWREVMVTAPSRFDACGDGCPVERVNWFEALAFANALSASVGLAPCYELVACTGELGSGVVADMGNRWERFPDLGVGDYTCSNVRALGAGGDVGACAGYRLPTRDEWIYLAAAGAPTAPWSGEASSLSELAEYARFLDNSDVTWANARDCSDGAGTRWCGTHLARSLAPNPWDIYDMLGNVREWTWTAAADDSEALLAVGAPIVQQRRITLGGSWLAQASAVHVQRPTFESPSVRSAWLGFRLVRSEQ